jgi:hypothetical protein
MHRSKIVKHGSKECAGAVRLVPEGIAYLMCVFACVGIGLAIEPYFARSVRYWDTFELVSMVTGIGLDLLGIGLLTRFCRDRSRSLQAPRGSGRGSQTDGVWDSELDRCDG